MCLLLVSGCGLFRHHSNNQPDSSSSSPSIGGKTTAADNNGKPIVTPDASLVGRVVRVNETARFAVLSFPVGNMPGPQQMMNVYRHGLKVGEVRVTDLRQDNNTVADIVKGDAEIGDEIRVD
jgi:hypothetical protein